MLQSVIIRVDCQNKNQLFYLRIEYKQIFLTHLLLTIKYWLILVYILQEGIHYYALHKYLIGKNHFFNYFLQYTHFKTKKIY